jgi:hypothetical protein
VTGRSKDQDLIDKLAAWIQAQTLHDVRVAWGRLGGRTTLHRYGGAHFAELARRRVVV